MMLNSVLLEGVVDDKPNGQGDFSSVPMKVNDETIDIFVSNFVAGKLEKGEQIRVVGRLVQQKFTNANGKKCYKIGVFVEHIEVRRCNYD